MNGSGRSAIAHRLCPDGWGPVRERLTAAACRPGICFSLSISESELVGRSRRPAGPAIKPGGRLERMTIPLVEALDVLARTPGTLTALLAGTSSTVYSVNEGEGTWSPIDVVGHLVRADETSWLPRARRILEVGESLPFDPPDAVAPIARFAGWTIDAVLAALASTRAASLETVRGWDLSAQDLLRRGHHPHLGIVTLGQLFATWAVHDLTHIAQIARVMAKRYGGDVGIWRKFLPILER